ncbi:MAG: bifunctional aspartate kinase/homoserine dehydrogenase I [Steroidobacteraceae bacterium]
MTTPDRRWVVHKFGGSSLADAACLQRVADIVEKLPESRVALVLSACRSVTDELLALLAAAERRDEKACEAALVLLGERHVSMAEELLDAPARDEYERQVQANIDDLRRIVHTVALVGAADRNLRDLAAGYGELWSSRLVASFLARRARRSAVRWIDSSEIIVVEWGALGPRVQWRESGERASSRIVGNDDATLVLPGFIASDTRGLRTTLGRNGSDLSGSIFGALLDAREIVIWTDVDGVLSADPRQVPDAQIIGALSYDEAMELAFFGAKVIHPQTMAPAVAKGIPIRIRNTFAPQKRGTVIDGATDSLLAVKGITSIDRVALVNVEGAGMIGVPGTAHRLFGALHEANISVIVISQGSSEHSICFAVPADQADAAERAVLRAFASELREGQIQSVTASNDAAVIAIVGDGMAGTRGTAGRLFSALGNAGINVRAIAQGASERNISVVIERDDAARALRAVHSAFYLSPHTLSIGLIGPGTIGSVLLAQLASQLDRFRREFNLDLRIRGIANSKRMLLADEAIDLSRWHEELDARGDRADLDRFTRHILADHLPHHVIVDCTADAQVASRYAGWFAAGMHVVTPNKKGNSAPRAEFERMQEYKRQSRTHYFYEATVGAGLPIILTVRDLRETGDRIHRIEGVLSGTLAYLFNAFDGTHPFSTIVAEAHARGLTEPDPRDDLSGLDVARKIVILAREMGQSVELADIKVESLVPESLRDCSIEDFLERFAEHDARMRERHDEAARRGERLRYVGRLTGEGEATVRVERVDASHPFAHMALTDNIVRFVTDRYSENPLVIQGPGAGPAVTAGGVFGDLLRLAACLGARI